ncbi:MAG: acyl carrier protein [Lachnospiraceae bacterium]|nr:acyl carrier protein [Lachnospiraceae bacterium]
MDTLLEILKDLHPDVDFELCDTLVDDKILDSFDIVTLISEINDQFDVTISAEDITPENFNSAESLFALIERLEDED